MGDKQAEAEGLEACGLRCDSRRGNERGCALGLDVSPEPHTTLDASGLKSDSTWDKAELQMA